MTEAKVPWTATQADREAFVAFGRDMLGDNIGPVQEKAIASVLRGDEDDTPEFLGFVKVRHEAQAPLVEALEEARPFVNVCRFDANPEFQLMAESAVAKIDHLLTSLRGETA